MLDVQTDSMRTFLRAIASGLRSWLSRLYGAPAARPKAQAGAGPDRDTSYETTAGVTPDETQPSTDARTTGSFAQPAERSVTDEGNAPSVDDASVDSHIIPGQDQGGSDGGSCERQGQEAVAGSTVESYPISEPAAEVQEPDEVAEVVAPAEPLAETTGEDLVAHAGRLVGQVEDSADRDGNGTFVADASGSSAEPNPAVAMPPPASPRKKERRRASQYSAPSGSLPPSQRSSPQDKPQRTDGSLPRAAPADIAVRIMFERGGYCVVSLLPKRLPGLPEELVVSSEDGDDVKLLALQDQWYQDVVPDNVAEILRKGIVWKDLNTGQEWLLSGREVFVFAHGTTHRGVVSFPRLSLGRSHVILCTMALLGRVEEALRASGCLCWSQFTEDDGVPSGWRLLREVVPQKPVHRSNETDIINILRPLPKIEVALEGGIRLTYNTWLLGYPPAIHIFGDPDNKEPVLIDGEEAAISEKDGYTTPGWDIEGNHQVFCSGISKTYSLVRSQINWTYWPAYSFAMSSSRDDDHKFEFCGPLVRPVAIGSQKYHREIVAAPATNPVLLGDDPGKIFLLHSRLDLRGARCLGLPSFDPVWALPPEPLRCDKRTNRILFVGELASGDIRANQGFAGRRDLKRWCQLILDANRKGLSVEPTSPETDDLWRKYKTVARSLWRRLR